MNKTISERQKRHRTFLKGGKKGRKKSLSPNLNTHFYKFVTFYFVESDSIPKWLIHNDTESDSIAGGTFALYSLLCRHVNIGILPSKHVGLNTTKDVQKSTSLARFFQTSVVARRLLLFVAMLGTCMLIGDGILTPAISGLVPNFCNKNRTIKTIAESVSTSAAAAYAKNRN